MSIPDHSSQISSIQDSLRTFNDNVARIGDLHSRSLNNMDDAAAQRNAAHLDELVEDTSALSATIKRRIKALEKQGGTGRDGQIRKQQVRGPVTPFVGVDLTLCIDRVGEIQVCGSYSKLPDCGATVPHKIQTANGEAVQNWCGFFGGKSLWLNGDLHH